MHPTRLFSLMLAAALLGACSRDEGQAGQAAGEAQPTMASADRLLLQQQLQTQANADGAKLQVTLGDGKAMRMEGVDRHGKPVLMHSGVTDITAAEAGIALYPGAQVDAEGGTRSRNEKFSAWLLPLVSGDAPAQVAAFYRAEAAKLKGLKELLDMPSDQPGSAQLVAVYGTEHRSLSITIEPRAEGGSAILISRSEPL